MDTLNLNSQMVFIIVSALLFGATGCFTHSSNGKPPLSNQDSGITQPLRTELNIDSIVNEIDEHIDDYDTTISYLEGSTEGGELICYSDDSELKKLEAWYYGETGKSCYSYYILNGQLIFASRKEYRYEFPVDLHSEVQIDNVHSTKCYWTNELEPDGCTTIKEVYLEIAENCL